MNGILDKLYNDGLRDEFSFWDKFLKISTTDLSSYFKKYLDRRLDVNLPLHSLPKSLLDKQQIHYDILDVGSGPFPFLGRYIPNKTLHITAIDKLACKYETLYQKYNIFPPTIPLSISAESLKSSFQKKFDLVYARNSIDHTQFPILCIQNMVAVASRFVLLEHKVNEGIIENYNGLHQWNFSCRDGEFIISDKNGNETIVNEYIQYKSMECYVGIEEEESIQDWLIVKIEV